MDKKDLNNIDCHAERSRSISSLQLCHAEFSSSISSLQLCHAERSRSISSLQLCHAEFSSASNIGSVLWIPNQVRNDINCHAERSRSISSLQLCHAEFSSASIIDTMLWIPNQVRNDINCHAERSRSISSLQLCHAERSRSISSLQLCHAERSRSISSLQLCHAEFSSASIIDTMLWIPNQVRNDILFKVFIILISLLILSAIQLSAQESNTKPLELPNFIIEGKEQLNIRSGIKQFPDKPSLLSKNELDSINSLEKRQSLLLPPEPLPDRIMHSVYKKGYFTADFGRFTTASAEGGYEFRAGEYDIFGNAGFDYSSGHIINAGYDKAFINLNADYIADEKYWIFGGSKTRTNLFFKNMDYKFYSVQNPEQRNTINLDMKLETDGNYEGFAFNTGSGFRMLQVKQDSSKAFDNAISGYISIKNLTSDYELGGNLIVDLHSTRGNGTHFMQADLFGTYIHENFSIKAKAGLQSVYTSTEIARLGLLAAGDMEFRLSELFTIRANALIGMENNSLREIINENPYADNNVIVDYAYYLPSLRGSFVIHPNEVFTAELGVEFAMVQRRPIYFDTSGGAAFAINYTDITQLEAFAELNYYISTMDEVSADIVLDKSEIEGGKTVPYSIPLKFALDYKRKWLKNFGTQIGIFYISERFTDLQNQNKLNSYVDLRLKADYSVSEMLNIFVRLENLMNNDIRIWNGYKERGLYITGGVLLKF